MGVGEGGVGVVEEGGGGRRRGGTEGEEWGERSRAEGGCVKGEGDFREGVLGAEEIEGRESDAEVDGRIESIDRANESMLVSGVRVQLTSNTLIDDDDDDDDDRRSRVQDVQSLQVGDYLEIEGRQRSSEGGFLEALSIEREDDDDDDDFELEARVTAIGAESITSMHLEVPRNGYSFSGAQVTDAVATDYRQTSRGQ